MEYLVICCHDDAHGKKAGSNPAQRMKAGNTTPILCHNKAFGSSGAEFRQVVTIPPFCSKQKGPAALWTASPLLCSTHPTRWMLQLTF